MFAAIDPAKRSDPVATVCLIQDYTVLAALNGVALSFTDMWVNLQTLNVGRNKLTSLDQPLCVS